ncbi:acyl-CoA synthetase [Paractinoplanes lichenicola]|uniref:Acyl-CoA synthetase n=1 Tax=Paractinoplanes lichenicola TaxID=2802976 RepID=A0ABS1VUS0_9ACTN|nr:acyl-CoA synthetase [Actinoplanes lichenicola]MBL7258178.1 acyl-CoA synthetase [Actinoplanes lichenicola]
MSRLLGALHNAEDQADAVRAQGVGLSRQELLGRAAAVANEITGRRMVAVEATPTLDTVVAITGALLAGVPVVPIPPDAGELERAHILADSGAELIDTRQRAASNDVPPEPDATRPALILYTSGTTGAPKGVVISRAALAADLDALAEVWQWTPDDTLVHGLPLFHVHGLVLGVHGPLRLGSRLVHTGKPTPQAYAATPGTLYFGVPTVWSRVCAAPTEARELARARLLVSGSAPLPVPVFERLRTLTGQAPVERYGMTETLITVSARADGERRAGHVGLPVPGVETRLVDDTGAVLRPGAEIGHLQVRGATLFDGYLNHGRPEREGWFETGDVATIGADGWHRIVGRASTDLIKTGGYRVGAGEVEDALLLHPAVQEAAVVGTPHPDLGEQITAYVVADGTTERELIDFVAAGLSVHKRPRAVHLVGSLPRNAMGKVQKAALR